MRYTFECCRSCEKPKRHPGCHAECEEYLEERRLYDEKMEEIRVVQKGIQDAYAIKVDGIRRMKKTRGKNRRNTKGRHE